MSEDTRMAAKIAVEILDRVRDDEKIISVHRHYPTGWNAFKCGFWAALGFISAVAVWICLTKLLIWAGELF